jgi:branched-chain amino acid transport system substrate-binding protein
MHKRSIMKAVAAAAMFALAGSATYAQQTIKIANIVELSGPGTTAGTVFKNGVELAVKEINENGGVLGKKIESYTVDTQTNPGVAKGLTQKAVDDGVFAIFGPVYSGSIMVSMAESKRGEVPIFTGGEAASITAQCNPYVFRTAFGQSTSFPKLAKFINTKAKTLAVIYVNNDFGKGGRDTLAKLLEGGTGAFEAWKRPRWW